MGPAITLDELVRMVAMKEGVVQPGKKKRKKEKKELGRDAVLIELSQKYVDEIAGPRIAKVAEQLPLGKV